MPDNGPEILRVLALGFAIFAAAFPRHPILALAVILLAIAEILG